MTAVCPCIHLISLGGTISMLPPEPGRSVSPCLSGRDMVMSLPDIGTGMENGLDVRVEDLHQIPSSHLQFAHLMELSRKIRSLTSENPQAGIVITTGTDTMEEAAYFIDLTYNGPNPVVFTAAMRHSADIEADGPRNILESLHVASIPQCRDLGVLVVMNGQIHAARDVMKLHTSDTGAFQSPGWGPLGVVNGKTVCMHRSLRTRDYLAVTQSAARVELVKCVLGMDGFVIQALLDRGLDALVIEALGGGHVPPSLVEPIKSALDAGVPVVLTSRCLQGGLFVDMYDYAGSETDLRALGVLFSSGLSGPKTRIKLALALGAVDDKARLAEHFPG